jgi:hypothetical protein
MCVCVCVRACVSRVPPIAASSAACAVSVSVLRLRRASPVAAVAGARSEQAPGGPSETEAEAGGPPARRWRLVTLVVEAAGRPLGR